MLRIFLFIVFVMAISVTAHPQLSDCGDRGVIQAWIKGFRSGDTVTRKTLLNGQVAAEIGVFKIISYDIIADGPGVCCDLCELSSNDKDFERSSKSIYKSLRPGSFVSFVNIRARDVNGVTVCLRNFFYVVGPDPPGSGERPW